MGNLIAGREVRDTFASVVFFSCVCVSLCRLCMQAKQNAAAFCVGVKINRRSRASRLFVFEW